MIKFGKCYLFSWCCWAQVCVLLMLNFDHFCYIIAILTYLALNEFAELLWFSLTVCTLCIMSLRVGMIIYVSFFIAQLTSTNTLWLEYFFWSKYELSEKDNVSAGILKIITEMFLPHIGLSELEEECFSKILPKVNNMLNTCRL